MTSAEALLQSAVDAILMLDAEGRIVAANPGAAAAFGFAADALRGMVFADRISKDSRDDFVDAWLALCRRDVRSSKLLELDGVRADDTIFPLELSLTVWWEGERCHGGVIVRDVSDRRRERQAGQAQRLDAVGRLAGGVAHTFNNLLTVMTGHLEVVLDEIGPRDRTRQDLERVRDAIGRATRITRQLLAFGRRQSLQPRVLDLNEVIAGWRPLIAQLVGRGVDLVIVPSAAAGVVEADAGQLEQVLMHLVVNARAAMPGGGRLVIRTDTVTLDAGAAERRSLTPGEYVMLQVTDSGHGMDRAMAARIFEPFFTTREVSKGEGLGLATVHGIVHQSGGHVEVESEVGRGTTFTIHLPQFHAAALPWCASTTP